MNKTKNFLPLLFGFLFSIGILLSPEETKAQNYPGTSIYASNGDMLVTQKQTTGITSMAGHAAMVAYYGDTAYVIHMPGLGKNIERMTLTSWFSTYGSVKVVRYQNSPTRAAAADWVRMRYDGWTSRNKTEYKITTDIKVTSPSYCSKMVWQAFYYGAGVDITRYWNQRDGYWMPTTGIVSPYNLLTANNTKIVLTRNW